MTLVSALRAAVGERHVLTDPEVVGSYTSDWTGRFGGAAAGVVVVRPADAAEVAAVLRACSAAGVAVVPQGGNTGMVGGSVPRVGGGVASPSGVGGAVRVGDVSAGGDDVSAVVLSTSRLTSTGDVDPALGLVEVGAGVTLSALDGVAGAAGFEAGVDFAARDSCTVGGMVACDAGGARALRHGTTRARIAGLEAVLADGTVVSRMSGLAKDNAGYALGALLIGSEGTLGVVTRVLWKLVPRMDARVVALVGLDGVGAAVALLAALRAEAPSLESCDFFLDDGLSLVLEHQRRASPLPRRSAVYVIAECAGRVDPLPELAAALERAGVSDADAVVADNGAGRAALWALREGHADAINAAGVPHKLDVGVPLSQLGRFLAEVPGVVAAPGTRTILFGHLGDGNVHVNVLGPGPDDERADDAVLELVLALGGTISAEHGVGVAKARWLERARGAEEVAAMRAVKAALDPTGVLNPGVVLPLVDRDRASGPPAAPARD